MKGKGNFKSATTTTTKIPSPTVKPRQMINNQYALMFPGYGHHWSFLSTFAQPIKRGISDPISVNKVCFPRASTLMLFSWDNGLGESRSTKECVNMQLNNATLCPLKQVTNIRVTQRDCVSGVIFQQTHTCISSWVERRTFPEVPFLGTLVLKDVPQWRELWQSIKFGKC